MKQKLIRHFINTVLSVAELSNCQKIQVGSILVKDNHIISEGYNGTPPGLMNCSDFFEHKKFDSKEEFLKAHKVFSEENEIHSEQNTIAFAARNGISTEGASMFVTHVPCYACAKLIIAAGIKEVYYIEQYEISGLMLMEEAGVKTYQLVKE
jgi:dCMP deaminase